MKKTVSTIFVVLLSILCIQAQKSQEKASNPQQDKLHIKLKDGAKPDVYVDGKKFDFPMDLLDPNRIKSINVIKGDKALKEYNAKNGVVLVTTKKNMVVAASQNKLEEPSTDENTPLIIINGERSDQATLKKLSPDDIESIKVFTDEQAIEKYNAPTGVIIVTTKNVKKE